MDIIQVRLSLRRKPSIMIRCLFSGGSTLDNNKLAGSASFPFARTPSFFYKITQRLIFSDFFLVDLFGGSASFLLVALLHTSVIDAPIARSSKHVCFFSYLSSSRVSSVRSEGPRGPSFVGRWSAGKSSGAENPHEATETWETSNWINLIIIYSQSISTSILSHSFHKCKRVSKYPTREQNKT